MGMGAPGCSPPDRTGSGRQDDSEVRCGTLSPCEDGFRCDHGVCVDWYCTGDGECAGGRCDAATGTCRDVPQEGNDDLGEDGADGSDDEEDGGGTDGSCLTRDDCSPDEVCREGRCAMPPATCASADDCPSGKACVGERCEASCTGSGACAAPLLCNPQSGRCEVCSQENPCGANKACFDGACVATRVCRNTGECSSWTDGTVCLVASCANCASDADCDTAPYATQKRLCTTEGLCRSVECTSDTICRSALGELGFCDAASHTCKRGECVSDEHCADAKPYCDVTTHTCKAAPAGCNVQTCTQQCQSQGKTCNEATCECIAAPAGCRQSADCGPNRACFSGNCEQYAVSGSAPCDLLSCYLGACVGSVTGAPCGQLSLACVTYAGDKVLCE